MKLKHLLNEKKNPVYTVFEKTGYSDFYKDKEDLGLYKFSAQDDFHAYVFIFMYSVLQDDPFNLDTEEGFAESLEYLEKDVVHQKVTEQFIKGELADLANSKYTYRRPFAEFYWVKKNGKILAEFNEPSVSSTRGVEKEDFT